LFEIGKIVGFFLLPSNALFFVTALGVLLLFTPAARFGRVLVLLGAVLLAIAGYSPFGNAVMLPLEQRFPPWDAARGTPDGIVVLGGAISPAVSAARDVPAINEAAERLTVMVELARRYPQARLVFSGGDGSLTGSGTEAVHVVPLLRSLGIASERIELESGSRSTFENATMSKTLAAPKPGERWLLVTSAHHMPRAIGCFRAAGFPVEAYPVDWRTRGADDLASPFRTLASGLARTDAAVHEWIGLAGYRLTGRIAEWLPAP
jgi:uncharacterized SAM-binding protein YcdF (DUF218 family)